MSQPPASPTLTSDWNLMVVATRQSWRECGCVQAWNASRVHSGTSRSCSPILPSSKLGREDQRLVEGPEPSSGRTWPPYPTPPCAGEEVCPPGSRNPSPPMERGAQTAVGGLNQPGLWEGPSALVPHPHCCPANANKCESACCTFKSLTLSSLFVSCTRTICCLREESLIGALGLSPGSAMSQLCSPVFSWDT